MMNVPKTLTLLTDEFRTLKAERDEFELAIRNAIKALAPGHPVRKALTVVLLGEELASLGDTKWGVES